MVSVSVMSIVIAPEGGSQRRLGRELWSFRELFLALVGRDLAVRYKQTLIGALWVILQPLALMLVFTVFFGYLGRFSSDGLPYPLFAVCGLLPWQLFARALNEGSLSVVANGALVQKVYFPRIILPATVLVSALVDFAVAFVVVLALMAYYGIAPTTTSLLAPLLVALALATSLGISLFFAALYVRFRDIRHVLPLVTQIWFFASPVFYSPAIVPENYRTLYGLNPMVGVIEGFRWALLPGSRPPDWSMVAVSAVTALVLFWAGLAYFRRHEPTFADRI